MSCVLSGIFEVLQLFQGHPCIVCFCYLDLPSVMSCHGLYRTLPLQEKSISVIAPMTVTQLYIVAVVYWIHLIQHHLNQALIYWHPNIIWGAISHQLLQYVSIHFLFKGLGVMDVADKRWWYTESPLWIRVKKMCSFKDNLFWLSSCTSHQKLDLCWGVYEEEVEQLTGLSSFP